jgi:hypothetical protein
MIGTADSIAWFVLGIWVYAVPSVVPELGVSALRRIVVVFRIKGMNIFIGIC